MIGLDLLIKIFHVELAHMHIEALRHPVGQGEDALRDLVAVAHIDDVYQQILHLCQSISRELVVIVRQGCRVP